MVHLPNGWFVVGGGYNGIEYNVLLIAVLIQNSATDFFKLSAFWGKYNLTI
ncbi:MAG: hypothetical protein IPN46_03480 [Saprospiraceae bacterium]|nr:hypothetical protein [Saprospiraceae bacterium]